MKRYRVEAFIIPSHSKIEIESNQIDDVKIAKKLKDQSFSSSDESKTENIDEEVEENLNVPEKSCEDEEQCSSEFSELFFAINEHIYDEIIVPENKGRKELNKEKAEYTKAFFQIEEPIYDEPFVGNLTRVNSKNNSNNYDVPQNQYSLHNSKHRHFGVFPPKLSKRSTSLKSIVEDIECFDETLQEICCHGRKNGCLLNNEHPEDISDDIFKENWIQRLDALRKLETLLKDKEVALQSRERLLFKKEKELRILERLVKDKMRQAELYARRCKKSSSSESIANNEKNWEYRSNGSKGHTKSDNLSNLALKANSKESLENKDEKILKNPSNSRSSLVTDRLRNRIGSVRSRSRPRYKMRFDDLDSTLSADIGDSSFIVTSKKFDPQEFRKPAAFARSASERRPRSEPQINTFKFSSLAKKDEPADEFVNTREEKTLKKISKNILASQKQETKFLNYGIIDEKSLNDPKHLDKESTNQKWFSYLNLESVNKTKLKNGPKERPISWSEENDDWLRKKRQAYNTATRKLAIENIAEKENIDKPVKLDKFIKTFKKKENNRKRFSLF